MLVRYTQFVDRSSQAAFLWSPARGIMHANVHAWEWTDDLVQLDLLCDAARKIGASARAEIVDAAGASFLLMPLFGADDSVEFVVGVEGAPLAELPRLLQRLSENSRYFSQIVHLLPGIVLTARPDGTFDYASRRWYQISGRSSTEIDIEESLRSALAETFDTFRDRWREGVASGEAFSFEFAMKTALFKKRWFELRSVPWYDAGRIRKWIVALNDVHDRVEAREELSAARRRSHALAQLGAVALDVKLEERRFLEEALRIAGSALPATWIVHTIFEEGRMVASYPPDSPLAPHAVERIIDIHGITACLESWPGQEERVVLRAPLNLNIPGRHRLILAGAPGERPFMDADVAFVADVAWRIESALRNRLTYKREARIARVLQLAMLPVALPRSASVGFDVAYQPAEVDTLIGGDWYDAFELRDGRLAFSIGDVAGHGLDAAVVMGHVREILRAMAMQGSSPAQAMAETNRVVVAGGHGLITAFLGYIDPVSLEIDYACAGHAPPIVVSRNGRITTLPLGDVILGAVRRSDYRDRTLRLDDEDALVLYTDGLVEHSHDPVRGETALCAALQTWAVNGFRSDAQELVKAALGGALAQDDVALLIVRSRRRARVEEARRNDPQRSTISGSVRSSRG